MSTLVVDKVGKRHSGKGSEDRLREGELILRDRNAGVPVSEMMAKYGLSQATIYRRIDEAIAARIVPEIDAYRAQMNAQLDDLTREWHRQLDAGVALIDEGRRAENFGLIEKGLKTHADALMGLLRVAERRSRLMGTDAPVRVEATVEDMTPNVDRRIADLAEQIKASGAEL